jgi:hypothetical protein
MGNRIDCHIGEKRLDSGFFAIDSVSAAMSVFDTLVDETCDSKRGARKIMKKKNKKKKTSRFGSKRSVAISVERITTWLSEHGGKRVVRNLAGPVRGQIPPGVPEDLGELWQIHDGQKSPDHSMFPDGLIFFSSKNSRLSEDDVEHYLALQYWAKLPPEEQRSLGVNLRPKEQQCREWFAIAVRDKMGLFVCGASGRVLEAEAGGGYQKVYPSLADFLAKYAEELERGTCEYDSSNEEIERISAHEKQRRAGIQKKVNLGKQVSKLWPRLNALGQLRLEPIELGDGFNLGLIWSMKGSDVLLTLANALEANARSRIATHYVTHYEFYGEIEESLDWKSHCFLAEHLIKKEFESILLEEFKPEPVWKSGHVSGPIAALLDEAGRLSKN